MPKKNSKIGDLLRHARLKNGMTQAELAKRLGLKQPASIANWENGQQPIPDDRLKQLVRILGPFTDMPRQSQEDYPPASGPSTLGVWVNRTRLKQGLTQSELKDKARLSLQAISNIETGRSPNPRKSTVERLEKALGKEFPSDAKAEIAKEATTEGLGLVVDIEEVKSHEDFPACSGIYVLYDQRGFITYVGKGKTIKDRIRVHSEKAWFKDPRVVQSGAYIEISSEDQRTLIEDILLKVMKNNLLINDRGVDRS
jgi:transcriptional regulator with XRE-family HTH domain